MPDPLILAFDTSAAHCAAALLSGDRVLAERDERMEKGQAERLFPMLEQMLTEAGCIWRDLTSIGVGTGPGNFTGVRISVAAARGLALSLGIPAVGVGVLEAMALGTEVSLCTVDARQGQVFLRYTGPDGGFGPVVSSPDDDLPIPAGAGPRCIGHLAGVFAAHFAGTVAEPVYPLAVAIARIARHQAPSGTRPAPIYIRHADALPPRDGPPLLLP